jgi:hypothetical protein
MERYFDRNNIGLNEDWHGNDAAFTCPACKKVFVVSGLLDRKGRKCPNCSQSIGFVKGGKDSGGTAMISSSE